MKKVIYLIFASFIFLSLSAQSCLFGGGAKGVFKSVDGGMTWENVQNLRPKGQRSTPPNTNVYVVKIDPINTNIVYTGTDRGVYKTSDTGGTWQRKITGIKTNSLVSAMVINPENDESILIGARDLTYSKIYKSTDGGENWRNVFVEPIARKLINDMAISNKNSNVVVACSSTGNVYGSQDSGETWSKIGGFGSPVTSVAIDNDDANIVIVGTFSQGIYKTTNFGGKWTQLKLVNTTSIFGGDSSMINVSVVRVAPSDSDVLYASTELGVFKSGDKGKTWQLLNTILPESNKPDIKDLEVNSKDSGTIYFSVPNVFYKASYTRGRFIGTQLSSGITALSIAVDQNDPNIIYTGVGNQVY